MLALAEAISTRYHVHIKPTDIKACHRISRAGTINVSFFDLKPGSPYQTLVHAMKVKGANIKDQALYANFTLTLRRSTMLYEIRKAFRANKLEKYYADFDGSLVLVLKGQQAKIRLTSVCNQSTNFRLTTFSMPELQHLLGK